MATVAPGGGEAASPAPPSAGAASAGAVSDGLLSADGEASAGASEEAAAEGPPAALELSGLPRCSIEHAAKANAAPMTIRRNSVERMAPSSACNRIVPLGLRA